MGKIKEFILDKEEENKKNIPIYINDNMVQCPRCDSFDIMVGEHQSVCLECNLTDESNLFLFKKSLFSS